MYTDQTLTCIDCSADFVFTAGEQEFFAMKGFQNKPTRCVNCRNVRRAERAGASGKRPGARDLYSVTCSECGQNAEVPFQPRGDKPVLCRDCFQRARTSVAR